MATFDGRTGGQHSLDPRVADAAPNGYPDADDAQPWRNQPVGAAEESFDPFAALREQMAERDAEEDHTLAVEVPGLGLRLVCDLTMPYPQFAKWQKAAFPRSQRNGRKTNPLDMDQALLCTFVLLGTCVGTEYRTANGEWLPLLDSRDQPVTPESPAMLDRFDQVDPKAFVRKLFGTDARVVQAGQRVMEAAGWREGDTDEEDPTGQG